MATEMPGRVIYRIGRVAFAAFALVALVPSTAAAQRGAAYIEQGPPVEGPTAGFPRMFNTSTVAPGRVAVDALPFGSVDVGLTENLSIGTYVAASMPILFGEGPAGVIRGRYRVYAGERVTSVLDATLGYVHVPALFGSRTSIRGWATLLGSNTSYRFGQNSITASAHGLRLRSSGQMETRGSLNGLIAAATYRRELNERWAVESALISLPVVRGAIENDRSATVVSNRANLFRRSSLRLLGHMRLGRWLLTGGVLAHVEFVAPWVSAGVTW